MKKICCFLLCVTAVSASLQAQPGKNRHRIKLELYSGEIVKGKIVALDDSSIGISHKDPRKTDCLYSITSIRTLSYRGRNAVVKGLLTGMIAGAGTGLVLGSKYSLSEDCFLCLDSEPGKNTFAFVASGVVAGSLIGLLSGSSFRNNEINGDRGKYHQVRTEIRNYQPSLFKKTRRDDAGYLAGHLD